MDNIYREELMEIYKNPPHRGKIQKPTVVVSKSNPLCGDEVTLQLDISNGAIRDAKFDGSACTVSIISSAFLTDALIGKSVSEAQKISEDDLLKLIGLNLTTSRVQCATLVLDALKNALDKYGKAKK